ncbi:MAG: TolC family protein [Planctomycetota bacterium]
MRIRPWWWPVLLLGCQSYKPKPLDPAEILGAVAEQRTEAAAHPAVTLANAAAWMTEYNPRIVDARAAFATAQGLADVPTPLSNPRFDLIPMVSDAANLGSDKWGFDSALGWSIQLGNKRKINDELNAIRADAARVELVAVEREEYLGLRREFIGLAMMTRIDEAWDRLRDQVARSGETMRRLVAAGRGTALDVRDLEWELEEVDAALIEVDEREINARFKLATRTGVAAEGFTIPAFPKLPEAIPELDSLKERLLRDHPGLARLRARYAVAEKELRLEVARQYPDLDIIGLAEQDQGTGRYGIGIGIDLPIFDRNQQGIARADRYRDEVRTNFTSQVRNSLADIEAAHQRLDNRIRRYRVLTTNVLPIARRSEALITAGLESGTADALRLLSFLRRQAELRIAILEAEWSVYEAWIDLETACGSPLLVFPDEPGEKEQK